MKILIGMDDAPCSQRALEFVAKMRWPAGSTFLVVSAQRPFFSGYAEPFVPRTAYAVEVAGQQAKVHEELVSRAGSRLRDAGLSTETRMVVGDPREVLLDAAAGERTDLIVVGLNGRAGPRKSLMGTVASHVMTNAKCNVMVVRPDGR
jgi:nucleotide-binding universal stress UspA family protein